MAVKILIIGATGFIGQAIAKEADHKYEWKGTYFSRENPCYLNCDITDPESLEDVFKQVHPTHVIHCGQLAGGVDFCEKYPDLAKKFHFEGTVNIGRQCQKYGCRLIFVSTECVFDGKKELYEENDRVNPLNIYGKFKTLSEEWLGKNIKDHAIVRSMSVYGWDPFTRTPNALMNAYFSVLGKNKVFVPTYRWGTPTYVKDLSKAILELCLSKETGLFHVAGSSYINRYEWIKRSFDFLGWDSYLIIPQTEILKDKALRPLRIGLDISKFRNTFKTKLHSLDEGLSFLKNDTLSGESRLLK